MAKQHSASALPANVFPNNRVSGVIPWVTPGAVVSQLQCSVNSFSVVDPQNRDKGGEKERRVNFLPAKHALASGCVKPSWLERTGSEWRCVKL